MTSYHDCVFSLVEVSDDKSTIQINLPDWIIEEVLRTWAIAGGFDLLRRVKPDIVMSQHWVAMPRSILRVYDDTIGEITVLYMRVFKVLDCWTLGNTAAQGQLINVPVVEGSKE